jgi:hypothetical protein
MEFDPKSLDFRFDPRLARSGRLTELLSYARLVTESFAWKTGLPGGFPTVICLLGGTGTGKSTIFNSICEEIVSRPGSKRPTTRKAVVRVHEDFADVLKSGSFFSEETVEISTHLNTEMRDFVLVDTPDFDSVAELHRRISLNFFILSDTLILVTSEEKHGDLAGHEILRRAVEWRKHSVIVFNKSVSGEALEHFRRLLTQHAYNGGIVPVERLPHAPELMPGFRARPEVKAAFEFNPTVVQHAEIENIRRETILALDELSAGLQAEITRIDSVIHDISSINSDVIREMDAQAFAVVTPNVEGQIRTRLRGLLRKYDMLYVPRQMLRDAIRSVGSRIYELVSGEKVDSRHWSERRDRELDLEETRRKAPLQEIESNVNKVIKRTAKLLASDPGLKDLLHAAHDVQKLGREDIAKKYDAAFPGIERLLENEFEDFRKRLSRVDELKFYGAFTLWTFILISAEIVVGGGFTLLDAVLDSVIVPFIPEGLLRLQIIDYLKEIGARVDEKHRESLRGIVSEQAEHYKQALASLAPPAESVESVRKTRKQVESTRI